MMGLRPNPERMTREEYLAREEVAEGKSEYLSGEAFAMGGGTLSHALIQSNLVRRLGNALDGQPCRVMGPDMRVKVQDSGLYTYPDLSVVCGKAEIEEERGESLLNPVVLVEVLSATTELYDRSVKFEHYARIPSLRHYVLVAQHRAHIDLLSRGEDGWILRAAAGLDAVLSLPSIDVELPLAEIYERVEFPS